MKKSTIDKCHVLIESALGFLIEDNFDVSAFIDRVNSVKRLIDRGATPGEKTAAELALQRLVTRAKAEIPKLSPDRQRELLYALRTDQPKAEPVRPTPASHRNDPQPADYKLAMAGRDQEYQAANGVRAILRLTERGYALKIIIGRKADLRTDDGKKFQSYQRGDQFHYSMGESPSAWICEFSGLTDSQTRRILAAYKLKLYYTRQ